MTAEPVDLLPGLQARLSQLGDETLRPLGMRHIVLGADALPRLPALVAEVAAPGRIVILEDATPMHRGDTQLKPLVADLLASLRPVERVVLGGGDGSLHADEQTLAAARAAVQGAGCVVTVGSGTLTDIGKDACHANPGMPLVAVQTAASVNGYADDMAVVLKDGVKRTVPSVWPAALVIDTQVLRHAPRHLTRSGFAEMMAMFTAPADWRLASLLGQDDSYRQGVVDLFRPQGEELLAAGEALAAGDHRALDLLATLLTTSGVAMGVAGRTAPLSGTEHLISHLLDMSAASAGLAVGLHGAQVGVAALVAACLWERVLARLDPTVLATDHAFPAGEAVEHRVRTAFSSLDSSGRAAAECWSDYQRKLAHWHQCRPLLQEVAPRWEDIRGELAGLVAPPQRIAAALTAAGAPTRFSQLDPPVDPDRARWAVASCHLMRSRFTVADLAFFAGDWTEEDVDAVLERAAALGGGL